MNTLLWIKKKPTLIHEEMIVYIWNDEYITGNL